MTEQAEIFARGVCYYPEHWPRERWAADARQMREMGLSYVRIGEFAWSRIEPQPGRFDWQWLDDAIETLAAAGLKIVIGTPTATPPAWLIRAHPEILPWDEQGRVRQFGSRKHYDHASPIYRTESRRITTAVAERYGKHPAVVGWQTDNEFGCHDTARSYGPASQAAFRDWLRARYGTIAALNEAWGAVFWSQEYQDWTQILPPNLTASEPNPSHVLDFYRFASDAIASFQEEQIAIIRRLSPGRWITHNFMIFFTGFDHYRVAAPLDFASWDCYPTGMLETSWLADDQKTRFARTGHPDLIGFNHDLIRGLKQGKPFWVMEQQAGHINWAPSNPLPAVGAVTLWTETARAHGAAVVSYFRWRAAMIAQELMHSGLLRHDATLDRGGVEIGELSDDVAPVAHPAAHVALLHDYESLWAYDLQPHSAGASYWRQAMLFYTALRELGLTVDVRHPDSDLSGYQLIVAPALQLMNEARAAHLAEAAGRAKLVAGPRTGYRAMSGQVVAGGQPGPLRDVLGCALLNFDGMRRGLTVQAGGHQVETWAESYRVLDGFVEISYDDGPLAGQPAVVSHANATTIGAWSPSLVKAILRRRAEEVGLPVADLPEGCRLCHTGQEPVWLNYNEQAVSLPDGSELGPVAYRRMAR